jgi:hypothetical protein
VNSNVLRFPFSLRPVLNIFHFILVFWYFFGSKIFCGWYLNNIAVQSITEIIISLELTYVF